MGVVVEGVFPGLPVEDVTGGGLRCDEITDFSAEQRAERLGEIDSNPATALDVDANEEHLVHLTSENRPRLTPLSCPESQRSTLTSDGPHLVMAS